MNKADVLNRLKELTQIIHESQTILNGAGDEFWQMLERSLIVKRDQYKSDCYTAAERSDREIRNFLGRMEAIDMVLAMVNFDAADTARRAMDEKISLELQLKENDIIEREVRTDVETPMYQAPGMI